MKNIVLFSLLIAVLLFLFPADNSYAQWIQTNGPAGGWCDHINSHNGYLYATSHGSTIYRSSDNGNNWTTIYTFPFSNFECSLTSQGTYLFFASSGNGVWRSADNGATWSAVNNGFPYGLYPVKNIVTSGQYIFCGLYRVFRSTDYGNHWDSCMNGMNSPIYVYNLSVIGNKVYAGTNKGAYVTTNNGGNWLSINSGITSLRVEKISSDGTSLYASTSVGIFKSTNEGAQWFALNNGLPTDWYYDLIYDGAYLITTTLDSKYRSSNGGQNWEAANSGLTSLASVYFYASGQRIFSALWGGAGIQYTTNHGTNWIVSNSGFYGFTSDNIAVKGGKIFTCGYMQGLAVTSDDGVSWQYIWNTMIDRYVYSVAANNSCVFLSTEGNGVLKSTNEGLNWTRCRNGIDSIYTKRLYAYDDVVFAFANEMAASSYRSTNNGETWSIISTPVSVESVARLGDYFLVGNSSMEVGGLIRSTNKGLNWSNVNPYYLPIGLVAKDSVFYFYLLGSSASGFYKSTNFGANWTQITPSFTKGVGKIYVVDNKFVNITGSKIYTNPVIDTNWVLKNRNLPYLDGIGALAVKGSNVFISTSYRGVWKIAKQDLVTVRNISGEVPSSFSLSQNYPNPFNQTSIFKFQCSMKGHVNVSVYDIAGREVSTLVNETLQPGTYEVRFDGSELNSGVYFVRMTAGDFSETKKMVLLK